MVTFVTLGLAAVAWHFIGRTRDPICPVAPRSASTEVASIPPLATLGPTPVVAGRPPLGPAVLVPVDRYTFGLNVATWDPQSGDPSTVTTIQNLGVGVLQFPNAGDSYNWQNNVERNPNTGYATWDTWHEWMSIDSWGAMLRATGARGLYIVDYGTNATWTGPATAADARSVTCYVLAHHIPVYAMVIGSEEYGSWAVNLHQNKTAQEYAVVARQMAKAIHAVAPSMLVGVDVTDPGAPSGGLAATKWNQTVIRVDAPYVQFLSVHLYPVSKIEPDSAMLTSMSTALARSASLLRSELRQYGGAQAAHIQIWATELGPYSFTPPPQSVQPVYGSALLEGMLQLASSGVKQVDWWDLHNDAYTAASAGRQTGTTDQSAGTLFGTFGIASTGVAPQPSLNVLYPSGTALRDLLQAVGRGAILRTWPSLQANSHVFVAEVRSRTRDSWVIVNDRPTSVQVALGRMTVAIPAATWRIVPSSG